MRDSPSSWAPPLGEGVISGLTLAPCSLLVDELGVTTPRVVGDAVAYGLAVAVARGPGDAAVGRGEGVVAGDALWVWAEIGTIAAPTKASVAPNTRDVFISDKDWRKLIDPPKKSPQLIAADVKTSGGAIKMRSLVNSDVDRALSYGLLHIDDGGHSGASGWCSRRLHAAHRRYGARVELDARRVAIV